MIPVFAPFLEKEREGGREREREGGRAGGREGVREGGGEGGREEWREGGMEGWREKERVSLLYLFSSIRFSFLCREQCAINMGCSCAITCLEHYCVTGEKKIYRKNKTNKFNINAVNCVIKSLRSRVFVALFVCVL